MTDNNQKFDTMEKIESNQKHSGKRRALVKGALGAVPVVLTMRSGAAFAASSIEGCIVRDNRQAGGAPPSVLLDPTVHDPWVRKRIWCRELVLAAVNPISSLPIEPPEAAAGAVPFEAYNEEENAASDWSHELNLPTPDGGTPPSGNIKYKEQREGRYNYMVDMSDAIAGVYYIAGDSLPCNILVHIKSDTILKEPDRFELGNAEIFGGDKLPYIMGSCWTSVDPNGIGPNPINV